MAIRIIDSTNLGILWDNTKKLMKHEISSEVEKAVDEKIDKDVKEAEDSDIENLFS